MTNKRPIDPSIGLFIWNRAGPGATTDRLADIYTRVDWPTENGVFGS